MDQIRIRMKTLCAGPTGVMKPGQEYTVDAARATPLIDGGYAERVGIPSAPPKSDQVETASQSAPENAATHTTTAKGGKPSKPPKS